MNDLISIVIPIYNSQEHLLDCLGSVALQSYSNLEVILVDDGSTDDSSHIAQKKAHEDARFFYYHKDNNGQSSARNFGVKQCSGEFIAFIDSDDIIQSFYIEELYAALYASSSQIAMSKFTKEITQLSDQKQTEYDVLKGGFGKLVGDLYASSYPATSPVCKLFHKSIVKSVAFQENMIYEDGLFFYETIHLVSQIVLVDNQSYYYRTSQNSTLTSSISEKNFDIFKKNDLSEIFFKNNHPEDMAMFYHQALNLNDVVAVKAVQYKSAISRELWRQILVINRRYAKGQFPRQLIYCCKPVYYLFCKSLSLLYSERSFGKENISKKIIKKMIR